jgi:hypothetical protein
MNSKLYLLTALGIAAVAVTARGGLPVVVAQDSANFPAYAPQPTHNWSPINGGFGYNDWTPLSDMSGGGTYMEGVGVNGRQVDGNYSFALYSGSGAFDISRPLSTSLSGVVEFDVLTRFDVAASPGGGLVNIRTGNNTSAFGAGELLSFGIINTNELSYTDGSGYHIMPSGEARGDVWSWAVDFNTISGAYTLSVTNLGGGFADVVSGVLEATNTSVGSFAVLNSSTGNNQNVIFDLPTFSVPEPETMSLVALAATGFACCRRRR